MKSGKERRAPGTFLSRAFLKFGAFLLILTFCLLHFTAIAATAQVKASPYAQGQEVQGKTPPEKIVGAPRNIRERTAIYVFIGWMWAAIAALVYFLRLKIREVDRLYASKFFMADKK